MAKKKAWLGWHFLPSNGKLRYDDGRRPKKGVTLTDPLVNGGLSCRSAPLLCNFGFHASKKLLDAVHYANGPLVARVRLSGHITGDYAKAAAMERTCLTDYVPVGKVLLKFARWCKQRHRPNGKSAGWLSSATACEHAEYVACCARNRAPRCERECAAQERELTRRIRAAIKKYEARKKKDK